MWSRYRKWKHVAAPALVVLGLILMRGQPDESARWSAGICIAVILGLGYIVEEVIWCVQNKGRPCSGCGYYVRMRPFALQLRCPECGRILE